MSEQLKVENQGEVVIARLVGRMDAKCVQEVGDELKLKSVGILLIDMSKVSFIDSSALGLIVSIFRRNQEAGGKFCLFGMSAHVRAVFELTRLHRIFDIFDSEGQALASLA